VSLLWPERLLVSLEPHALAWARPAGRGRTDADPGYGPDPWHGVVEAFKREAAAWRRERLAVSVTLSNGFARYAIVPRHDDDATREEDEALARFHFARVHGERARSWEVRLSGAGEGPRLACAVDAELVQQLKACFGKGSRARLVSVQPYLMSVYNRWRPRIPREGAWLALAEPERKCLALYAAKGWRALQSVRGPADWLEMIERERQRASGEPLPAMVMVRPPSVLGLLPLDDAPQPMRLAAT